MSIQVLIATMHQNDYQLLERIGLESDAVVVNQCDNNSYEHFEFNGYKITWINSTQRGLSRSRNLAIENAEADICLLVDDDENLQHEYSNTILNAFAEYPEAAIIGFQVFGIESTFKNYTQKEFKVGYIKSMKMASVEIAFRRQTLLKNGIRFDENIGAGTKYKMGEENAMLFKSLSKKLSIYYVPQVIGHVHIGESTWFEGFNKEYFHARGAVFTAMSRRWALLLIFQFALRKYYLYKNAMSVPSAIKFMLNGRKAYLQEFGDID